MRLDDLIARLEKEDPSRVVPLGFANPHSYRGHYEQLAFEPAENVTVGEMLAAPRSALGATYDGYKGGEFTMGPYTPCWLSEYGTSVDSETLGAVLLDYMLGRYDPAKPEATAFDWFEQGGHWYCFGPKTGTLYSAAVEWWDSGDVWCVRVFSHGHTCMDVNVDGLDAAKMAAEIVMREG